MDGPLVSLLLGAVTESVWLLGVLVLALALSGGMPLSSGKGCGGGSGGGSTARSCSRQTMHCSAIASGGLVATAPFFFA